MAGWNSPGVITHSIFMWTREKFVSGVRNISPPCEQGLRTLFFLIWKVPLIRIKIKSKSFSSYCPFNSKTEFFVLGCSIFENTREIDQPDISKAFRLGTEPASLDY